MNQHLSKNGDCNRFQTKETVHADPRSQHGSWGRDFPNKLRTTAVPSKESGQSGAGVFIKNQGIEVWSAKQVSNLNTKKVKLNWWEGLTTTAWKCWERQWIQNEVLKCILIPNTTGTWPEIPSLLPVCLADILRQEAPWVSRFSHQLTVITNPIDCLCPLKFISGNPNPWCDGFGT